MAEAGWHELRVEVHGRPVFVRMGPEIPGSIPLVHVHGFAVSGSYLLPTARALAFVAPTASVPSQAPVFQVVSPQDQSPAVVYFSHVGG